MGTAITVPIGASARRSPVHEVAGRSPRMIVVCEVEGRSTVYEVTGRSVARSMVREVAG
jgi:hypothetical protein